MDNIQIFFYVLCVIFPILYRIILEKSKYSTYTKWGLSIGLGIFTSYMVFLMLMFLIIASRGV